MIKDAIANRARRRTTLSESDASARNSVPSRKGPGVVDVNVLYHPLFGLARGNRPQVIGPKRQLVADEDCRRETRQTGLLNTVPFSRTNSWELSRKGAQEFRVFLPRTRRRASPSPTFLDERV